MCAEEDWSIFARWRLVMDMTAVTGRTIDEPRSGRQTVIIMDHDYTQDVSCVALLSMTQARFTAELRRFVLVAWTAAGCRACDDALKLISFMNMHAIRASY